MKTKLNLILSLLVLQSTFSLGQTSGVPGTISYQGRVFTSAGALVGAGTPVNRTVIFRIWDSPSATTAANLLYSETQTVTISEGEFSVLVGNGVANTTQTFSYSETAKHSSASPSVALADVFNGSGRYLGVTVAGAASITAADAEISPRQQIVSSAFAFRAKFAETLGTSTSGTSLKVLDNGNVGVGNASPPSVFTVTGANSSNAAAPQVLITATDTTERLRLGVNDSGTGIGFIQAWKEGTGAQSLTLNSEGGNVGIGTSAPDKKLTLVTTILTDGIKSTGNSGSWNLLSPGLGAGAFNGITTLNDSGLIFGGSAATAGTGGFVLAPWVAGASASGLRMDNAGKVGIGNPTPTNPLSVTGNADFSGNVGIGSTSSPGSIKLMISDGAVDGTRYGSLQITREAAGHTGSHMAFVRAGNNTMGLGYGSNSSTFGFSNGTTGAFTPSTLSMTSDGLVGIGTSTPQNRLHVNGFADFRTNTTTDGFVRLSPGSAAVGGWLGWYKPGGVRVGYMGSGTNDLPLVLENSANFTVTGGKVGIGTATPTNALSVGGSADFSGGVVVSGMSQIGTSTTLGLLNIGTKLATYQRYGGLSTDGGSSSNSTRTNNPLSIAADGTIYCALVDISSDSRIKTALHPTDSGKDLQTLMGIEVTDYRFKDSAANGNAPQKKVIAQQLEKVYPQAVSIRQGVVPDVYQNAGVKDGWVMLATDLKVGDRVKIIAEEQQSIQEVLELREGAFRTSMKPVGDKVFVYGREVPDFHSVDYDAIAMLNVSATQELIRKNASLQAENDTLKGQLQDIMAADAVRDAKLAAIEKRLSGGAATQLPVTVQAKTRNP